MKKITVLMAEVHLNVRLRVFAGVEKLDGAKRTVLCRVAQEALTNVTRHARATQVELCIEQLADTVQMNVKDNVRSFSTFQAKKNGRLGLLGMRERVAMVGGRFAIESAPGHGTTIEVQVPAAKNLRPGKR